MTLRYRKFCQLSRALLPRLLSGGHSEDYGQALILPCLCRFPTNLALGNINRSIAASRFSTVAEKPQQDPYKFNLMSFVKSSFDELRGRDHCWLNISADELTTWEKDGVFLVVADSSVDKFPTFGHGALLILEKAKLLQKRYPWLNVFALQTRSSVDSTICQSHLFDAVMQEYISFPILCYKRTFKEMRNGASYLLFKGFSSPPIHFDINIDLGILHKAIEDLNGQHNGNLDIVDQLASPWSKQSEVIKEPYASYYLKSLLLQFPACISADESGDQFFLSDCNHHRVIAFDGDGKILDVIGSSPGFEDGAFDTAKLMRPAASYYDGSADYLYILDSENHAVRRAHMETRVLETLSSKDNRRNSLWTMIMNKLGIQKDVSISDESGSDSLMFPWHFLKSDDDLLIMNRSFDTLWTLTLDHGVVKEVMKGSQKIVEVYGEKIANQVSLFQALPHDEIKGIVDSTCPLDGIPYSGLLSSFVTSKNHFLICDAVNHRVVKFTSQDQIITTLQLSSFGALGLPYWLPSPLEKVYCLDMHRATPVDHLQSLELLPGTIDMQFFIEVPSHTVLVEPIQEGSIWRLVRGSAVDVSGMDSIGKSSEKVGVAQQWYDELDNLTFETESEVSKLDEKSISSRDFEDGRIRIQCTVNTSPGTSEVIIFAVLYLKLKSTYHTCESDKEKKAAVIADVLKPEKTGRVDRDEFIHYLAKSSMDLEELVFTKPVHVRIQLNNLPYPKSDNGKNYILTNSAIEVNVSLC